MSEVTPDALRKLIGYTINFRGQPHTIVEILDPSSSAPQLVLRSLEQVIQPDQWGDAHRRVPASIAVDVLNRDGELNPELSALFTNAD